MEAEIIILLAVFLVCEVVVFVLSVFGNLVVCYVMIFKHELRKPSSKYILSTSVADLLVGLVIIPTGIPEVKLITIVCHDSLELF